MNRAIELAEEIASLERERDRTVVRYTARIAKLRNEQRQLNDEQLRAAAKKVVSS